MEARVRGWSAFLTRPRRRSGEGEGQEQWRGSQGEKGKAEVEE